MQVMTTANDVEAKIRRALLIDGEGNDPSPDAPGVGTRTPLIWVLGDSLPANAKSMVPLDTAAGRALVWPLVDPARHRVSNVIDTTRPGDPPAWLNARSEPAWLNARWDALGRPATVALGVKANLRLHAAGILLLGCLTHPDHAWRFRQGDLVTWKAELHALLEGVHPDMPAAARQPRADDGLAGIKARLAAAPGRVITARVALDRTEAFNLSRRLRRAGLGAAMRRVRNGTYAVLVREKITEETLR